MKTTQNSLPSHPSNMFPCCHKVSRTTQPQPTASLPPQPIPPCWCLLSCTPRLEPSSWRLTQSCRVSRWEEPCTRKRLFAAKTLPKSLHYSPKKDTDCGAYQGALPGPWLLLQHAGKESCTGRSLATQDLMDQRHCKFCLLAHKQDIYPRTHINESTCAFAHLHEPWQLLFDFLYSPVMG